MRHIRNFFIYILLFVNLNVNASVLIDGIYYNLSTNTATVTHGTNIYSGSLDIPAEIEYNSKTYTVTAIGEYAFQNCTSLSEVNLPNTITYIRHYSFSNSGISKIILPESVTNILEGAFNACSTLKTIEINSKINIGKLAFNNTGIEKVCIPSLDIWCGIKFYSDGIDDCKSNPIKGADLYVNGEIVEDLIFPDTIATIQARSFSQCRSIKRVFIPSNITHMGVETFAGCSSIEYAENMSSLPFSDYAFQGCKSLKHVKYGKKSGVRTTTFEGCDSLFVVELDSITSTVDKGTNLQTYFGKQVRKYVLPEGIRHIGASKFYNCDSLESINIPSSVESIGENAFGGCKQLNKVYIDDLKSWCKLKFYKAYVELQHYQYTSLGNNPLMYGAELYVNNQKIVNLRIPNDVKEVPHYAFMGCISIETLEVPKETTYLGDHAFGFCGILKKITFHGAGTYHDACFIRCDSLEEIDFYGDYKSTGTQTNHLCGCKKLTKIRLSPSMLCDPYSSQIIGDTYPYCLFKQFPYVKEYVIPEGVESIGSRVFGSCDSLRVINIPSSVSYIGTGAFVNCKKLKQVKIADLSSWCKIEFDHSENFGYSENPLVYGADLYLNNERLTDCVISEDISTISDHLFYGCGSIESVVLPSNLTVVGNYAFARCQNLEYIKIPDANISFGTRPFANCPKLTSIGPFESNCSIEYTWQTSIPSKVFEYCDSINKVIISSTINQIGDNTFFPLHIDEVYCNAMTPPTISSSTFFKYGTLYVPGGTLPLYSTAAYWKKFKIVELVDIENIEFESKQKDLILGDTVLLEVVFSPSNATYKELYWQSSDSSVAMVDDNGQVVALKTGTAIITASTTDGSELTALCEINVTNPVASMTLDTLSLSLEVGQSYMLTATCHPENADDATISWKSEDETIAKVEDGKVTALKLGTTKIKACSVNGIEAACDVSVVPTLATNISLDNKDISLHTGDKYQLSVNLSPNNATYKDVVWSSKDSTIVNVDDCGVVKALGNGTTDVYVKTTDGTNLTDSCRVTVTTLAQSIELNKQVCNMIIGEGMQLIATILPSTTTDKNVLWKSSDESIAKVDDKGYVIALSTGRASVSAMSCDGTNLYVSCIINVSNPVRSVSLNKIKADIMVGQSIQLIATCTPSNADDTTITWYSENPMIATVKNGIVTGHALGRAVITANSVNGKEAKCTISVIPTPVTSVSLDRKELNLNAGDTYMLITYISPSDATNKNLIWESSNSNVASISSNGLINALATGQAIIQASATDGSNKYATCIVNVKTPVRSITVSPEKVELLIDENAQLTAKCLPVNADNTVVKWTSDDEQIATVSANGIVTAKSYGEAVITATTTDGTLLYCDVPVKVKKHPQSIEWNQDLTNIQYGGELIVLDAHSSSGLPVMYSSSNDDVVSIFDMGNVVYLNPINPGSSIVTVTQVGNSYYEEVSVSKEARVIGPNGVEHIMADNGKYIVTSINGLRIGVFSEEEYHKFIHQGHKGLFIVNGIKKFIK